MGLSVRAHLRTMVWALGGKVIRWRGRDPFFGFFIDLDETALDAQPKVKWFNRP
jgi:hypothetical protein